MAVRPCRTQQQKLIFEPANTLSAMHSYGPTTCLVLGHKTLLGPLIFIVDGSSPAPFSAWNTEQSREPGEGATLEPVLAEILSKHVAKPCFVSWLA